MSDFEQNNRLAETLQKMEAVQRDLLENVQSYFPFYAEEEGEALIALCHSLRDMAHTVELVLYCAKHKLPLGLAV